MSQFLFVRISPTALATSCINNQQPAGAPRFNDIDQSRFQPSMPGLRFYDIEFGSGVTPQIDDAVKVQFTGWLDDGCMFETSYIDPHPATMPLVSDVLGWQQGLSEMQVGGTHVMEIAPYLAYGQDGFPPGIPAHATLIFHVNLLKRITIEEARATMTAEAGRR